MKKILLCLLTFFCGILCVSAKIDFATLEKCTDGDTANFLVSNTSTGEEETIKVRFLAINAPELKTDEYGKESSDYTCNILTNSKEIILESEENATTDKYGRTLAWIWVDGELLQGKLVQNGYAEVAYIYGKYKYTDSLCLLQKNAIEAKLNIWNGSRKEGYCVKVDTSKVEPNINYEKLIENNLTGKEKDLIDSGKKIGESLENFNNKASELTDDIAKNQDEISSGGVILVFVCAGVYLILKEVKTFKGTSNKNKK